MKNRLYLALIIFFTASCGTDRESVKPYVGTITESVYASGKVKAIDQYNVYSTVTGILQSIKVAPGDSVKEGDTLFILENKSPQLNSESALAALELSRENAAANSQLLREIELNVSVAKEKFELDSSLYMRQKELWQKEIGSQLELEQRQLAYKSSSAAFESAKSKLAQVKSQVSTELKRAGLNYDITRKGANDFIIRSLIMGKVFDVMKDKNELVSPQTPLAVLGKANVYELELEVDEYNILKIQPGQKVYVTMDSYKGKVFNATVRSFNPIMNERSRTFTVYADFEATPDLLFPNLTVETNIVISEKENAITIPLKFLSKDNTVFIGKSESKSVKTGLRDYQKVEILDGVDANQLLYLPPAK